MRYWLSWWDAEKDYRPLTDPPHPQVLGWWCSGEDMNGRHSICALVDAPNEKEAMTIVEISWPETASAEFRFVEENPDDYVIASDRFPLSGWMKERMQPKEPGNE